MFNKNMFSHDFNYFLIHISSCYTFKILCLDEKLSSIECQMNNLKPHTNHRPSVICRFWVFITKYK